MGFPSQFRRDNSQLEVDVTRVNDAIVADSHTVLDVREPEEWDDGHIAEAVHIPLGELATRAGELPANKPIYTVCRSGVRSITAIEILEAAGYAGAKSLAGGVIAWDEAGKLLAR